MRSMFVALAVASGLAFATGPPVQGQPPPTTGGMPMGGMKTVPERNDQNKASDQPTDKPRDEAPNQAQAPPDQPERVTPTYRDTTEDRIMREKTDDGAHDRDDMKR